MRRSSIEPRWLTIRNTGIWWRRFSVASSPVQVRRPVAPISATERTPPKNAREAEAIAICSGAFFGGVRSVALMGATGLLTCTGELATLNLRHQIPVFLIVSQRGSIDDQRIYQEVQGRRTISLLQTYDFPYHIVNRPDEIASIPDAYETCRLQKRPFVLFITRKLVKGDTA